MNKNPFVQKSLPPLIFILALAVPSCSCKEFNSEVLYKYAGRLQDQGQVKKAVGIYEMILKGDPKNAMVRYDLGVGYCQMQELEKAEAQRQKLLKLGREDLAEELGKIIRRIKYARE